MKRAAGQRGWGRGGQATVGNYLPDLKLEINRSDVGFKEFQLAKEGIHQ